MFYIVFFLLFSSFSIQAEIFQWVDIKGNTHYSDKPHDGAEILQVKTGYTFYKIKKIYDGDTILLSNGKKIRFLGINTPEVEGRNKSAQPGGKEAKQWLTEKLKKSRVRLGKDVEKKDKYGRLLAHVFTEDGEHINLELVKKGLASVSIYPPNLNYIDDLLIAQDQAEEGLLGIWSYTDYLPKQVSKIGKTSIKGWQRVSGRVKNVRHSRKYSYLDFSDTFGLKIARKSLGLFPELESYVGKQIEARGWIKKYKGLYRMFIRHPSALKLKTKL
jgi:micrococcal nuclease